jgi:hypothetical protein
MNNDDFQSLREKTSALPREIPPARDLWPGIHAQMVDDKTPRVPHTGRQTFFSPLRITLAAAALVFLTFSVVVFRRENTAPHWSVATLSGEPRIDDQSIKDTGKWRRGQWLETNTTSRASLTIGDIGEVRLEPGSRVRLLGTDAANHRLELSRGTLHALIWAPPRLFFVETPSATAVDLGCAYSLTVDDAGAGTLHVTSGYVALEHRGREALVPAGWICLSQPGIGPGTPFSESSTPALRHALRHFDFIESSGETLLEILPLCAKSDAITLWHLLSRVASNQRGTVFEKLAALQPPPAGITREGIIAGDRTMLAQWAEDLGLSPAPVAGRL